MRHLIVGAGASIAQADELQIPQEFWPPSMQNFAVKTWATFTPWPFLPLFLEEKGIPCSANVDLRAVFFDLERKKVTNIEDFIEFAWLHRDLAPPESGDWTYWDNFMRYGIGDPLALLINQAFMKDAQFIDLPITREMLSRFASTDLILSLNYDPLIEVAFLQNETPFAYIPNQPTEAEIPVCKPHGSLNMAFTKDGFMFGDPSNLWPIFPTGDKRRAYTGIIPPRSNKSYAQSPMARAILAPVRQRCPDSLVMWGLGLTGSDIDLNDVYRTWARGVECVDIINPDKTVAPNIEKILNVRTRQFDSAESWLSHEENR
jgi:hypothetical protein